MAESSLPGILILSLSFSSFLGELRLSLLAVTLFLVSGRLRPLLRGSSNTWASYSSYANADIET